MYDDEGNVVSEPEEARRMFATPKNLLVSIVEDNDNSTLRLYLSKSTHLKKDHKIRQLIQSLRLCASKYNMMFQMRKHQKDLKPKDFSTRSSVTEGKTYMTELTEGLYGTSRSSYLTLENARMIIRHTGKINEEITGARSRMIESILIENEAGERFRMPTNHLAPARAMTQHVNQGGTFADQVGGQIQRMGQAFADLGSCAHFVGVNQAVLPEGALPIREKCMGKRKDIRKSFSRLARESTYKSECDALHESFGEEPLVEAAVLEDLRNLLTLKGKELSETVLQTVAAQIHETDTRMIDEDEKLADPDAYHTGVRKPQEGTAHVLGHNIPRETWKAFLGQRDQDNKYVVPPKLALRTSPNLGAMPDFKTKTQEIFFKLEHIVPVVQDDAMSNLLADVAEKYPLERNPDERRKMLMVAITALQAANVQVKVNEGLGPRGVDAILEFEAWFDTFDANKVLMETQDCDEEECGEELEEEFVPFTKKDDDDDDGDEEELEEGFFDAVRSAGGKIANSVRDLNKKRHIYPVRLGSSVYDVTLDHDRIYKITSRGIDGEPGRNVPLDHPLAKVIAKRADRPLDGQAITPVREDIEDTDLDADAFAGGDDVDADIAADDNEQFVEEDCDPIDANVGNDDEIMESEFDACEDDDCEDEDLEEGLEGEIDEALTREDVLLPKNPGLDLAREVSAHDEDEDDVKLDEEELDEANWGKIGKLALGAAAAAAIGAPVAQIAKQGMEYHRGAGNAAVSMQDAQSNNAYNDAVKAAKQQGKSLEEDADRFFVPYQEDDGKWYYHDGGGKRRGPFNNRRAALEQCDPDCDELSEGLDPEIARIISLARRI